MGGGSHRAIATCSAVIACDMLCERHECTLRASAFRIEHGENYRPCGQISALGCCAVAMPHVRRPLAIRLHWKRAPTCVAATGVSVQVTPCVEQFEVVQPTKSLFVATAASVLATRGGTISVQSPWFVCDVSHTPTPWIVTRPLPWIVIRSATFVSRAPASGLAALQCPAKLGSAQKPSAPHT
jgi:hypothetical protein